MTHPDSTVSTKGATLIDNFGQLTTTQECQAALLDIYQKVGASNAEIDGTQPVILVNPDINNPSRINVLMHCVHGDNTTAWRAGQVFGMLSLQESKPMIVRQNLLVFDGIEKLATAIGGVRQQQAEQERQSASSPAAIVEKRVVSGTSPTTGI